MSDDFNYCVIVPRLCLCGNYNNSLTFRAIPISIHYISFTASVRFCVIVTNINECGTLIFAGVPAGDLFKVSGHHHFFTLSQKWYRMQRHPHAHVREDGELNDAGRGLDSRKIVKAD